MGRKAKDLIGFKHERITVIERIYRVGMSNRNSLWLCKCDCGNYIELTSNTIYKNKSCGCLNRELISKIGKRTGNKNLGRYEHTNIKCIKNNKPNKNKLIPYKGIYFNKINKLYYSRIRVNGEAIYLGSSKNIEDVIKLRKEAEEKYFKPLIEKYERETSK